MNKKNLREMARFLIKIDYRKSPFYIDLPNVVIRTSGYALEQYLWFWDSLSYDKYHLNPDNKITLINNFQLNSINYFLTNGDKGKDKIKVIKQNDKLILGNDLWQWCFSPEWEKIALIGKDGIATNAEREVGWRILWLLKFGLPPNWKKQISGEIPPDYKSFNFLLKE